MEQTMTDTTQEVTAVETPAAESAEVTAAPITEPEAQDGQAVQPPEPKGPLSKKEARKGLRERAAEVGKEKQAPSAETVVEPQEGRKKATPVIDKEGRKHDPVTGEYLPGEEEKEPEATTEEASPEATEPQETNQDAEPDTPEQEPESFRIQIDPQHPVANMNSVSEITAQTKEEADVIRALMNATYARRSDVETARKSAQQAMERAEKAENELLRMRSSQTAEEKWKQTDQYRDAVETYRNIQDTVGQDAASRYWRGIQADLNELRETEFSQAQKTANQERVEEAFQAFAEMAWGETQRLPEAIRRLPNFRDMFTETLQMVDARVGFGHFPEAKTQDQVLGVFRKEFLTRLNQDPAIAQFRKQAEETVRSKKTETENAKLGAEEEQRKREEEIRRQAVEEYKRGITDSRAGQPPHPLGNVRSTPSQTSGVELIREDEGLDNLPPNQLRKQLKQSAKLAGRQIDASRR